MVKFDALVTWVANKDFGELELRTSPNFRTSFFVEIANFTELQNFFQQFSKDAAFWKNPEKIWPKFGRNLAKIRQNLANFAKICKKTAKFSAIFNENFAIRERCKGVHCVDLGESFPTSIYLQNLASIQPRTSPEVLKFELSEF